MAAATVDALAGGRRVIAGLGVSGPQVVGHLVEAGPPLRARLGPVLEALAALTDGAGAAERRIGHDGDAPLGAPGHEGIFDAAAFQIVHHLIAGDRAAIGNGADFGKAPAVRLCLF